MYTRSFVRWVNCEAQPKQEEIEFNVVLGANPTAFWDTITELRTGAYARKEGSAHEVDMMNFSHSQIRKTPSANVAVKASFRLGLGGLAVRKLLQVLVAQIPRLSLGTWTYCAQCTLVMLHIASSCSSISFLDQYPP